ncbi:hypothetical protein BHM03_00037196, partial [Ensete ventricosum]
MTVDEGMAVAGSGYCRGGVAAAVWQRRGLQVVAVRGRGRTATTDGRRLRARQRLGQLLRQGRWGYEEEATMVDGLQVAEGWSRRQWQRVLWLVAAFGCVAGKKKGAAGFGEGCRRGGGPLAAAGGAVDVAGQRLAAAARRWLRAGEGGGSDISVRSAQRWLRLRAREAATEATLEEKGR